MPIIELQGVNHSNKGGQLMLVATRQHMEKTFPSVQLAMSFRVSTHELREAEKLKHIVYISRERFPGMSRLIDFGVGLVPRSIRNRKNIVRESDLAMVLDASGFRYSDQWGTDSIVKMARRVEAFRNSGRPFVFLPQAWGPFTDPAARAAVKRMVEASSLIFARDRVSLGHLTAAAGHPPQLRIAPDFTNLVAPSTSPDIVVPERSLMIVPNSRMLDKMGAEVASAYLPFLTEICRFAKKQGFNPVVLVHDAEEDIALGRQLKADNPDDVTLITDQDPLRLKAYLGKATAVVSSRFHAIVAALSLGTPTIAIGWSHKYNELMDDYGCKELSLRISDRAAIFDTITAWSDDTVLQAARDRLLTKAQAQKDLAKQMWSEVDAVIGPALRKTR